MPLILPTLQGDTKKKHMDILTQGNSGRADVAEAEVEETWGGAQRGLGVGVDGRWGGGSDGEGKTEIINTVDVLLVGGAGGGVEC